MCGIRHSTRAVSLGPLFGGTLRLTATYGGVRIRTAETKWKPNGNIAAATDSAITASA